MDSGRKANLFIVGAMKAGTTSFNEMLSNHPDIYFSPIKEPNYFIENLPPYIFKESPYFSLDKYFKNDFPSPLHIARIINKDQYGKLYEKAEEQKYLAEGSTAYLHAPESAGLIYQYNPDAKIIILVRDGLKRAFSHYKMDVGLGRTTEPFEKLIEKNWQELQKNNLNNWSYIGMSLYEKNIERYRLLFGNNVMVIQLEEFLKDQSNYLDKIFSFLHISTIPVQLNKSNESVNLRFKKGLYLLKKSGVKDFFSYILPQKWRHSMFKMMQKKEPEKLEISNNLAIELKQLFNNEKLNAD